MSNKDRKRRRLAAVPTTPAAQAAPDPDPVLRGLADARQALLDGRSAADAAAAASAHQAPGAAKDGDKKEPVKSARGGNMFLRALAVKRSRCGRVEFLLPTTREKKLVVECDQINVFVSKDLEPYEFARPGALLALALRSFPQHIAGLLAGQLLTLSGSAAVIGEDGVDHGAGDILFEDVDGLSMLLSSATGEWLDPRVGMTPLKPRQVFERLSLWLSRPLFVDG